MKAICNYLLHSFSCRLKKLLLLSTLPLVWLENCVIESLDCQTATEQRLCQLVNKHGLYYASNISDIT